MKYIALDIGNVLAKVNFTEFLNNLSRYSGVSSSEAFRRLNLYQSLQDVGLINIEYILEKEFNITSDIERNLLVYDWNNSIVEEENNNSYSAILKWRDKSKYKLALLSNIGIEHSKIIISRLNRIYMTKIFDDAIHYFSCNVGVRKPTSLYYTNFLNEYPEFKGCTYFDDLLENINTAKRLGYNAIQYNINDGVILND